MKLFRASVTVLVLISFILQPLAPALAENVSSSLPNIFEPVIEESTSSTPSTTEVPISTSTLPSVPTPETISTSTVDSLPVPEVLPPVETKKIEKKNFFYPELMRSAKKSITEGNTELKKQTAQDIAEFISQEKTRLDDLQVDKKKQKQYLKRLKTQMESLDDSAPNFFEKVKDFFGDIFLDDTPSDASTSVKEEEIKIPNNPASFGFSEQKIDVFQLQDPKLFPTPGQKIQQNLKKLITIDVASAMDDQFLPVVEDVQPSAEVIVNEPIRELASSLDNNPVTIVNYVRNAITYEPYFGAKKGNLGCLQEKICNDVDSASLTISLFRAAGIPARYKKSLVTFRVQDLKNIFGVEDTKSVYLLFAQNKIPVSTVTVPIPPGATVDQVDISAETHLAVEWVFPEVFYEYDERGANIPNGFSLEGVSTTESMRATLQNFPKKQWIPVDTIFKTYTHTKQNILTNTANLNVQTFWDTFLTYQGGLSPLEKFAQDIQSGSGRNVSSSLSTVVPQEKNFKILPITLPFILASGNINGTPINLETWSVLPDVRRDQMRLSLRTTNDQLVLEKNFFASEINNKELNLFYEGLTDVDKQVIEQAGGIHNTPADLVDIVPVFHGEMGNFSAPNPVAVNIGDTLVLRFEMYINGQMVQRDEKFSVAGNSEGIYLIFSQVQAHPEWDTNSRILLGGNSALAWEYLRHIEAQRNFLNQFFDYSSQIHFARAVVTENRSLNKVNNVATNFDFKGLTIDAGVYISSDVSRRDAFTAHREDFRKLFGLEASYAEGQVFERVSGLEAVSTIKGLQYAALHPETYTINRITLANRQVIDGLLLSENTKANMRTAVDAGDTVITPNKPVQMGNWTGVLYISISPLGVGRYAIGEQVMQNGGWTISQMLRNLYINASNQERIGFLSEFGETRFYYQDGKDEETLLCRITVAERNFVRARPDWDPHYGEPCFIENKRFGSIDHSYLLTSEGAYFLSPGRYDYWVQKSTIEQKINDYIRDKKNLPGNHLNALEGGRKMPRKFSPTLGTYIQPICETNGLINCGQHATLYYTPNANGGSIYRVRGDILSKVGGNDNFIIKRLGFPQSDEQNAAASPRVRNGVYQGFLNGHIYKYKDSAGRVNIHYTYGRLTTEHSQSGGTGGALGFPKEDPRESGIFSYQEFEGYKEIGWNRATGVAQTVNFKPYRCEIYGKINNPFVLTAITGQGIVDTGVQSVEDLLPLLGGIFKNYDEYKEMYDAVEYLKVDDLKGILSALGSGLVEEYNTSIGPNGCDARSSYIVGRMAGEAMLIYMPASKLKAVEKIGVLGRASRTTAGLKASRLILKWVEYRDELAKALKVLPIANKFVDKGEAGGVIHIILGKFNKITKRFQGDGFHSPHSLKKWLEEGAYDLDDITKVSRPKVIGANDARIYESLRDIPTDINGVREVRILKTTGYKTKSFFPEEWPDEVILDAISEASTHRVQDSPGAFFKVVTRNGKSVPIRGYLDGNSNLIETAFAEFTH